MLLWLLWNQVKENRNNLTVPIDKIDNIDNYNKTYR
jgi:hypothetical protein